MGLAAEFAGQRHVWDGEIVRTEGELDPRSRMVHVVAQVADPYGRTSGGATPLAVGLFVEATIAGRQVPGAFVLPRSALREGDQVYVVDEEDRRYFKQQEIVLWRKKIG